jgi:hypothetical protein
MREIETKYCLVPRLLEAEGCAGIASRHPATQRASGFMTGSSSDL